MCGCKTEEARLVFCAAVADCHAHTKLGLLALLERLAIELHLHLATLILQDHTGLRLDAQAEDRLCATSSATSCVGTTDAKGLHG